MISRRSALKCSLAALAGASAGTAAAAGKTGAAAGRTRSYDAVIIGAGTAGLVAAVEAHDLGLKPVVLEKIE